MSLGTALIVYHGCDVTTRDDLVSRRLKHLDHSKNKYDWLGPGAYFFEGDVERALLFAQAAHHNPDKRYTARPIATPAVVGAVLQVQSWLDMTTQAGIKQYGMAYEVFAAGRKAERKSIPKKYCCQRYGR